MQKEEHEKIAIEENNDIKDPNKQKNNENTGDNQVVAIKNTEEEEQKGNKERNKWTLLNRLLQLTKDKSTKIKLILQYLGINPK